MELKGEDVCGIYARTRPDNIMLETGHDSAVFMPGNNIIPHYPPRYEQYATEEQRMKTFKERLWPVGLKQRPEELANAGFYYRGISDQVLCFYCEGGLQNWEPTDDIWEEHAKHFPQCGFLNVTKSPEYVRKVQYELKRTTQNLGPLLRSSSSSSSSSTESTSSIELEPARRKLNMDIDIKNTLTKEDEERLREENLRLKDERLCKICADKELAVVFIPCGHFVTCASCAASLPKCPVCRTTITSLVKTYLS